MRDPDEPTPQPKGQFLVYQAEDGRLRIDVRLQNETAWLTQSHMAELFQTTIPNVSMHLRNVFAEGELQADSVVQEFLTTATDGKNYSTKYYNLDAIISVGYRVKSAVATRFRIWATQKLREFIVKGFVLGDERLKNPDQPFDYFEEEGREEVNNETLNAQSRHSLPSPDGRRAGDEGAQHEQTIVGRLPLPSPLPLGEAGVRVRRLGEERGEGAQRVPEILEA